jgi:hypothetical protein
MQEMNEKSNEVFTVENKAYLKTCTIQLFSSFFNFTICRHSHPSLLLLMWLYNCLCRVLAFSTNSFHLRLSWARVFQFGTFNFCISFLTSFTQLVLLVFLKCVSSSILPLPFSYLASFRCDRASSVFVLG